MTISIVRLPDGAESLARVRPVIEAIPEADVNRHLTLDIRLAVETVAGNLGELELLRPPIRAELGERAIAKLDELPIAAAAAQRADDEHQVTQPAADLSELSAKVVEKHALLLPLVTLLVMRGLVDAAWLERSRSTQGYRTQSKSLSGLELIVRDKWDAIGPQNVVTMADLDEAKVLSAELQLQLGLRAQATAATATSERRLRAISYFLAVYDEVQRIVRYVRWKEGDADRFAPSLWTAQRGLKSGRKAEGGDETSDPEVASPTPAPVAPVVAAPVTPPVVTAPVTGEPTPPSTDVAPPVRRPFENM